MLVSLIPAGTWDWQPPTPIAPDAATFDVPHEVEAAIDPALLQTTLARPLFFPSRRPLPADGTDTAEVADAKEDALADLQLLGLFSTGRGGGLIVREDGVSRRVAVGGTVGNWTLVALNGLEARFKRGDEEALLQLRHSELGSGATASADARDGKDETETPASAQADTAAVTAAAAGGSIADDIRDRRARRLAAIRDARERLKARREQQRDQRRE
ncbi:MAG: hypothetical protein H6945_15970 [Zoogloeaceae bacterium]|nr:hypothetical protein [Rhodocyclaceae bacterium]MCP5237235.1 hypothetical protein [Zoogloeaceae bacterium]